MHRINIPDLLAEHETKMIRISYSITKNIDISKDCVQDAFIKLFMNYESLQDHPDLVGWLYQTMIYRSKSARRRNTWLRNRTVPYDSIEYLYSNTDITKIDVRIDAEKDIEDIIEGLSDKEKKVFFTYFVMQRTLEETAAEQGTTVTAIKSIIQRIRGKARKNKSTKMLIMAILFVRVVHLYHGGGRKWPL